MEEVYYDPTGALRFQAGFKWTHKTEVTYFFFTTCEFSVFKITTLSYFMCFQPLHIKVERQGSLKNYSSAIISVTLGGTGMSDWIFVSTRVNRQFNPP